MSNYLRDISSSTTKNASSLMSFTGSLNWVLRGAVIFSVVLNFYFLATSKYSQTSIQVQPQRLSAAYTSLTTLSNVSGKKGQLNRILMETATSNRTIILTYLNEAWIAKNSMFDIFLDSFRHGDNTQWLLNHLLVVSLDEKAYLRCIEVHAHCYHYQKGHLNFTEEASYMTSNYLEIVWRKIDFMQIVLRRGYNFIFTDGDILWFRDPFPHLTNDANFQLSSDTFNGDPTSVENLPNTGFMYVQSDVHTIIFFKIWYLLRYNYEWAKNQDVFIIMKDYNLFNMVGLRIKFLDTVYFSGFCQPLTNFNSVCTMHANCCIGLAPKVHDLQIILNDWKNYSSSSQQEKDSWSRPWSAPDHCHM